MTSTKRDRERGRERWIVFTFIWCLETTEALDRWEVMTFQIGHLSSLRLHWTQMIWSCIDVWTLEWCIQAYPDNSPPGQFPTVYSLNKKEWICSLFKEWILEKSEIRVNLEWICSLFKEWILEKSEIRVNLEWICSLFKEWILEKSEIRVNLEWTSCVIHSFWSDHRDHSGIPSDPWGHSKMSE